MNMPDIRDNIFRGIEMRQVIVSIIADDEGIVVGTDAVRQAANELGLSIDSLLDEGSPVSKGDKIGSFSGTPKQVAVAEERLIGLMAKPSGIATAARRFVEKAGRRPEIVSGAWKKMPGSEKEMIRRAIITGGARYRICREPFLFLDKNYVKMLGGVSESLRAVADLNGHLRVVQLKGVYGDIALEACEAVEHGADIVFIDSGNHDDLKRVGEKLRESGLRDRVKIAFGSGICLEDIESLKSLDVDILDIGRQIVDAPLLDMRLEVVESYRNHEE
jgi:nicotinate-nucleotide pyrophosphorylase (carboxylating)